ncbi:hypothetical protein CPB85DRAFT_880989 [Mucidula mucida]|nr:hypothetical protein CPB85DRAFT_880989 [Mucidula mucida]
MDVYMTFPWKLIDEIISCNQDDIAFLQSVSLVSKIWRAAAFRYLFSEASFLCKNKFVRWRLICASSPHAAQSIRSVVVDLGKTHRLQERAKSVPTGFVTRAKLSDAPYMEPLNSALDCTFPKDSEFDLILTIMRNATSLDWTMPSTKDGFDYCQYCTLPIVFPKYHTALLLYPDVQGQFIIFFHKLRKCTFSLWAPLNSVHVFSGHGSCFSISRLEEIWIEECKPGAMDWLLDSVLDNSPSPMCLRKLGWDSGDPPFSSNKSARLICKAQGTLEELCFRPPWTPIC